MESILMLILRIRLPLLLVLAALLPNSVVGQSISGEIRSLEDSTVVAGATVVITRIPDHAQVTKLRTLTDAHGRFSFAKVVPGNYELQVSMIGYSSYLDTVTLGSESHIHLMIYLKEAPVESQQVIVTASKYKQSVSEVPVSVSLVSSKSMSRRNILSVDDALRYVPGVNFVQYQANIRGSSGFARGIGSRVLVLLDGIPLLAGDTGEAVWESIPVTDVDHIEVVKGSGSALYGSSALGGVIDIITRDASSTPSTRVKTYGGFYEQPRYSQWVWSAKNRFFEGITLDHTQQIGSVGVVSSISYKKDDGYRENDFFRRGNLFIQTNAKLDRMRSIKFFGDLFSQYSGNFLYWQDVNHALQPVASSLGHWVKSLRLNIGGIFTDVVNDNFFYTVRSGYYFNNWYDNFGETAHGVGDTSTSNLGYLEIQATSSIDPFTVLTLGLEGRGDYVSSNLFTNKASFSFASYLQIERKIGSFRINAGSRFDHQRIEGMSSYNQFNPKLGLVYDINGLVSIRASVGSGFRAPSIGEVYASTQTGGVVIVANPLLLPEKSFSSELGARFPLGYVMVDASLFQNDYWDMIEPQFRTDGKISFQNVTRARIQGYEIDAQTDLFHEMVGVKASYTYIYPKDITANDILKYRSRELLYASLDFSYGIFRSSADFRYISKFERYDKELVEFGVVKNGNKRVPAYVLDVRAGIDLAGLGIPIEVMAIINNAGEYYYVEMIGNIAPIRNYSLALEVRL
ncbi:MAG: TonB-dependent receptor [Candidatus Kryptoniota bacterium]